MAQSPSSLMCCAPTPIPMDPSPNNAVSVNEIWVNLHDDARQAICDGLVTYKGPDVGSYFYELVNFAYKTTLATESKAWTVECLKRKRIEDRLQEQAPIPKRTRISEPTVPSRTAPVESVSLKIPYASRQSPISSGQLTFESATAGKSPNVRALMPAKPSASLPNVQSPDMTLSKMPKPGFLSQFLFSNAKAKPPVQQEPQYDEQFTFADRRASFLRPHAGPAARQSTWKLRTRRRGAAGIQVRGPISSF